MDQTLGTSHPGSSWRKKSRRRAENHAARGGGRAGGMNPAGEGLGGRGSVVGDRGSVVRARGLVVGARCSVLGARGSVLRGAALRFYALDCVCALRMEALSSRTHTAGPDASLLPIRAQLSGSALNSFN